jgi:serine phosphatase RsbU (regulator of sigma subunit)
MVLSGYGIASLSAFIYGVFLSFFIYIKRKNSLECVLFCLFALSVSTWCLVPFVRNIGEGRQQALVFIRLLTIGGAFIPPFVLHFAHVLIEEHQSKKARYVLITSYTIALLFSLNVFSPNFIKGIDLSVSFYRVIPGPLYTLFLIYFSLSTAYGLYILLMAYKISKGRKKSQIKYFFFALFLAFLGGSMHVLSTYFESGEPFSHDLFLISYLTVLAYAIIRYRLMEIDTVIHRTFLWLLTLVLVILPIGLAATFSIGWIVSLSRIAKLALISAVFVFFVWYYSKLKPHIDHIFRRRKYDYYQVLGEIGQKIGSELDINNVIARLFKELKDVLYIRNGLALVQQPDKLDYYEAGSTGYESLLEAQKPEKVILNYQNPLSQWLNRHQKALEREQVEIDPQYEPIKQETLSFINQNSVELLIPVIMENKVNALLGIGKKENLQSYTIKDIELLENMGRQIGITIDNAMHHEDIVEKERLAEEMKLGREIQMSLLPRQVPSVAGLIVQGLMQPAKEIGGDYYDFIPLPHKNQLAVVIGDVSGKGVAAGLLMAMAKTAIHTLSQEEVSPKQILLKTNNILNQHIGGQKFMTMLYFRWDVNKRILTYSSAGHEHILLYRSSGGVESILSGGFMLGMIPDIDTLLEDRQLSLNIGDKVILYTDGVTEARNPSEELFSLKRLTGIIAKHGNEPAQDLLSIIKEEVYTYIGTREQYDDITLVVMEAV